MESDEFYINDEDKAMVAHFFERLEWILSFPLKLSCRRGDGFCTATYYRFFRT